MSELIDRQAFIENERKLYCEDCDRRKGTKNGKPNVICYEIGEAPCRACWLDDALTDLEDFPTASPWHRVEEELPKEEGRYFIAVFYKGKWLYNVAWFVKDIGDILGVPGSDGNGGFVSNSAEVYPDCWMMPIEPPKEDE